MTSHSRDVDGGWAWVALTACAVCVMMTSGLAVLAGMFQNIFLEELDEGVVITAWVTSLFSSLMQLSGPAAGVVCSLLGCRASVMSGAVLLTVGLFLSSFGQNIAMLLFTFGVSSGVGLGLIYSAAVVMVNLCFVRYRPMATGAVLAAGGLGIIVLPPLASALLRVLSWRQTLAVLGCLSAQLVVAGALLFPPYQARRQGRSIFNCCRKSQKNLALSQPDVQMIQESETKVPLIDIKPVGQPVPNGTSQESLTCDNLRQADTQRKIHNKQDSGSASSVVSHKRDSKLGTDSEAFPIESLSAPDGTCLVTDTIEGRTRAESDPGDLQQAEESESNSTEAGSIQHEDRPSTTIPSGGPTHLQHYTQPVETPPLETVAFLPQQNLDNPQEGTRKTQGGGSSSERARTWLGSLVPVLTNPSILIICLHLFLSNAGVGIVLVYYPAFCLQHGSNLDTVSLAYSADGIGVTLSRFLVGVLAQDVTVDPLCVFVGLALIMTFCKLLTPVVALTSAVQIFMLGLVGVYNGGAYALLTEITIHCTGVDTLSLTFGLEMISAGLGYLVAPPLAGWLVEKTGSYSNTIFLSGFLDLVAAVTAMALSLTRPVWKPAEQDTEVVVTSSDDVNAIDVTSC